MKKRAKKMRRIDPNKIAHNAAWDVKATAAEAAVSGGEAVNDYSKIWAATKGRLKAVSHGKCWYCEARQERADNAVDHYRPKSIYPWLAFKLSNYRYACTFCNSVRMNPETGESSGKGDHFPIFNVHRATKLAELIAEEPVLLDPCCGTDPALLDFREDGRPCARYPAQVKRCARAEQSIHYYHLDHPELVESRRQLALQIKDWIDGADAIYNDVDQGDPNIERAFSKFVESICRAIGEAAEFSVFSRRMVDGYRDRPWIEDLLQCA
jgi:uncharacterized protein (TIGR02646 family)